MPQLAKAKRFSVSERISARAPLLDKLINANNDRAPILKILIFLTHAKFRGDDIILQKKARISMDREMDMVNARKYLENEKLLPGVIGIGNDYRCTESFFVFGSHGMERYLADLLKGRKYPENAYGKSFKNIKRTNPDLFNYLVSPWKCPDYKPTEESESYNEIVYSMKKRIIKIAKLEHSTVRFLGHRTTAHALMAALLETEDYSEIKKPDYGTITIIRFNYDKYNGGTVDMDVGFRPNDSPKIFV